MQQTFVAVESMSVKNGAVNFYRVIDASIFYDKLFALDTAEQNKVRQGIYATESSVGDNKMTLRARV